MATIYQDIYIDVGADFETVISMGINFDDYNFVGVVRRTPTATTAVPITFASVENFPQKIKLMIDAESTLLLKPLRAVYDIFAANKITDVIHKAVYGIAFIERSASIVIPEAPPEGYTIPLDAVDGAGTAAAADTTDFATALQGVLAGSALQPEDLTQAALIQALGFPPHASLSAANLALPIGQLFFNTTTNTIQITTA